MRGQQTDHRRRRGAAARRGKTRFPPRRGDTCCTANRDCASEVIACRHTQEQMEKELYIVVDNGCAVLDVTVEHPVYGQISGQLQLFSRYDVDQFVQKLRTSNAPALCTLTGGCICTISSTSIRRIYSGWSSSCVNRDCCSARKTKAFNNPAKNREASV